MMSTTDVHRDPPQQCKRMAMIAATGVIAALLISIGGGCDGAEVDSDAPGPAAWIEQLREGNAVEREAAAKALAQQPHGTAFSPLRRVATRDHQVAVRAAALEALAAYGDEAREVLINRLDDDSERVRLIAARALGRLGDDAAAEALGAVLDREHESDAVRLGAITALGRVGPSGLDKLLPRFEDAAEQERATIIDAVARAGKRRHAPVLIEAMTADDTPTRRRAARALGGLGTGDAIEPILALVDLIRDPIPEAERQRDQRRAQRGPNKGDLRAIELYLDQVASHRSPGMHGWLYRDEDAARGAFEDHLERERNRQASITRQIAARTLVEIGTDRARQTLRELAADDDQAIHEAAVSVYGELGEEAVDELYAILDSSDQPTRLRKQAIDLLVGITTAAEETGDRDWAGRLRGRFDETAPIEAEPQGQPDEPAEPAFDDRLGRTLLAIAEDSDPGHDDLLAAHAAATLAEHDIRAVRPALERLLGSETEDVAEQAVSALRGLGEAAAAEAVLELAMDADRSRDLRAAAARAAGRLGDEAIAERLLEILEDADSDIRVAAAEAIGEIGQPGMGAELVAVYEGLEGGGGEARSLRRALIETFGKVKAEEAVDLLIEHVKAYDHWIEVRLAMVALSHIGDERAIEPMSEALRKEPLRIRAHQDYVADHYGIPALVRFNDPRAIETLLYLAQREGGGPNTPVIALRAIGDIDHPDALGKLIDMLADPDIEAGMKESAIAPALIDLGEQAVPELFHLLREASPPDDPGATDPGIYAAELLAFYGWSVAEKVVELVENPDTPRHVLRRAILCLREVGDDRAVAPLTGLLEHSDERVRRWAVDALDRMEQDTALAALHRAKEHDDEQVRQRAEQAIKDRRDRERGADRRVRPEPDEATPLE